MPRKENVEGAGKTEPSDLQMKEREGRLDTSTLARTWKGSIKPSKESQCLPDTDVLCPSLVGSSSDGRGFQKQQLQPLLHYMTCTWRSGRGILMAAILQDWLVCQVPRWLLCNSLFQSI